MTQEQGPEPFTINTVDELRVLYKALGGAVPGEESAAIGDLSIRLGGCMTDRYGLPKQFTPQTISDPEEISMVRILMQRASLNQAND